MSCLLSPAGIMFNTGIGQHILKNPLVVNGIIDKVGGADAVMIDAKAYMHITANTRRHLKDESHADPGAQSLICGCG